MTTLYEGRVEHDHKKKSQDILKLNFIKFQNQTKLKVGV
jgi:hypothetical protein